MVIKNVFTRGGKFDIWYLGKRDHNELSAFLLEHFNVTNSRINYSLENKAMLEQHGANYLELEIREKD